MALVQKEVVVVKLYRVDPELALEQCQDRDGALRSLRLLPAAVNRDDAAEVATIGAADACLVDRSAQPKKSGCDVFFRVGEPVVTLSGTGAEGGYASIAVVDAAMTVSLEDTGVDPALAVAAVPNAATAYLALTEIAHYVPFASAA